MKRSICENMISTIMLTVVALALILIPTVKSDWPKFVYPNVTTKSDNAGFIIEKIYQKHNKSNDMRSSLYLTHHAYLLEKIASLEVHYGGKPYKMSDICFKPHFAVFHNIHGKTPHHYQRLMLEIRRLSPCLIVTPLNCFSESYKMHALMSRWNSSTDFLNRRLRNAYIESQGDNENAPYVKSDYGPELIKEWSQYLINLSAKNVYHKAHKAMMMVNVYAWLQSIRPNGEKCIDPNGSCDEHLKEEDYFSICTEIQQLDDEDVKRNKYQFETGDEEFMSQLDCVEDRHLFIEWMQGKALKKIMKTFPSERGVADHEDIVNQRCEGIFHDWNTSSIEYFDGDRYFASESSPFDVLKAEIALMTPEMIVDSMNRADHINGFELAFTLEKATELLNVFRTELRNTISAFNEIKPSKTIGVVTGVWKEQLKDNTVDTDYSWAFSFIAIFHLLLVVLFALFMWPGACYSMVIMFTVRDLVTVFIFMFFHYAKDTDIQLDSTIVFHVAVLTVTNLFLTTRVAFCKQRLDRCIQRAKNFVLRSNFSSIGTVDSVRERGDTKLVQYVLAKYTKYQAAQDVYSEEPFEKRSRFWICSLLLLVPILCAYAFFINFDCFTLLICILPSLAISTIEEYRVKFELLRERKKKQESQRKQMEEIGQLVTGGEVDQLFAGNQITTNDERDIEVNSSHSDPGPVEPKTFYGLSDSTCDNIYMTSFLIWVVASLFIFISSILLFVPVQRETIPRNINEDDMFFDFSVENTSGNWDFMTINLREFTQDIKSIENLQMVSNWYETFIRYNKDFNNTWKEEFGGWLQKEPINWAVTYPRMETTSLNVPPYLFQFQFRYWFKNTKDENLIIETVQKIDNVLTKYSKRLAPKASGVLYEHYHQIAVVWNSFAINELIASGILFVFCSLFVLTFSVCRTLSSTILFSFFVVGTRLEVAAIVSLLSLEHQYYYTTLAALIGLFHRTLCFIPYNFSGFLAAWSPFCDLARFRRRILHRLETRVSPELAPKRRIRVPFIAAVDVIQFFGTLLIGSILTAILAGSIPSFNTFIVPIAIIIFIQLCALVNSIAILLSTKQMFEHEVVNFIRCELRGCNTSTQVCDMTGKLLHSPEEAGSIEMNQLPIQPTNQYTFYAPPPKKDPTEKRRPESDDDEEEQEVEHEDVPMNLVDQFVQKHGNTRETQQFRQNFYPLNARDANGVFIEPVQFLMSGMPMDGAYRRTVNEPINIERAEEQYEQERRDTYSDEEDEEEEEEEEMMDYQNALQRNEALRSPDRQANVASPNVRPIRIESIPGPSLPPMIQRARPRDPRTEPPILEEFIQAHDIPGLGPHPRADQYAPGLPRSFIAYCEDPFWTNQRTVRLPPGIMIPPRPFDYAERERLNDSPPPADPNWMPPPGTPPIAALADALAFRDRLQQEGNDDSDASN
ncbi:hypothetical protein CAEBREN_32153 [Caenorhabditis brenneri]|uniref:Uncharacterized protein n=1 Tax=Caenorhabditis brenneri TaxID=135651 RepID=G0N9M8_CAEBE|nr:hypothetical protein CAEBREN_32153 [Caenorhabditis brenneri]